MTNIYIYVSHSGDTRSESRSGVLIFFVIFSVLAEVPS